MNNPRLASAALGALAASTISSFAFAQESGSAQNPILVPAGCTAQTQASGQVVIVCPPRGAPAPAAVVVAPAAAGPSAPQGPPPAYRAPPREEKKWYGWETLIVDGAVIVSSVALAPVNGKASGILFNAGYLLGGPIVHWSNGQVGRGFASLGIRAGAPLVVGLTGFGLGLLADGDCSPSKDICAGPLVGLVVGVVAGYVTAIVVDSAVLAHKTVQVDSATEAKNKLKLKWAPTAGYDPSRRLATVGIGGTF